MRGGGGKARERQREIERESAAYVDIFSDDQFPQTLMNQFKFRHLAAYFPSSRKHNTVTDYSQ